MNKVDITKQLPYYKFEENNWKLKLEGRYWNPGSQNICIVASITNGIDWAAYIGACPNAHSEDEALKYVADWGAKLSKQDAEHFFPEIKLSYRY